MSYNCHIVADTPGKCDNATIAILQKWYAWLRTLVSQVLGHTFKSIYHIFTLPFPHESEQKKSSLYFLASFLLFHLLSLITLGQECRTAQSQTKAWGRSFPSPVWLKPHKAASIKEWLHEFDLDELKCPDQNPIKHIWYEIIKHVTYSASVTSDLTNTTQLNYNQGSKDGLSFEERFCLSNT